MNVGSVKEILSLFFLSLSLQRNALGVGIFSTGF